MPRIGRHFLDPHALLDHTHIVPRETCDKPPANQTRVGISRPMSFSCLGGLSKRARGRRDGESDARGKAELMGAKPARSGYLPINGLSLYHQVYGELGTSKP